MQSLPSWAIASLRRPLARASFDDQQESLSEILNPRTARPTQGGSSPCGNPRAKHTAASTHIWPGVGMPLPSHNPASTTSSTLRAWSLVRVMVISNPPLGVEWWSFLLGLLQAIRLDAGSHFVVVVVRGS